MPCAYNLICKLPPTADLVLLMRRFRVRAVPSGCIWVNSLSLSPLWWCPREYQKTKCSVSTTRVRTQTCAPMGSETQIWALDLHRKNFMSAFIKAPCGRRLLINYRAHTTHACVLAGNFTHETPLVFMKIYYHVYGVLFAGKAKAGSHQPCKDTIHLKQLSLNYVLSALIGWHEMHARHVSYCVRAGKI